METFTAGFDLANEREKSFRPNPGGPVYNTSFRLEVKGL
jgi:hypothetical protein